MDTRRRRDSVRVCFLSMPTVAGRFFRIGRESRVSLPPPARRTDTCELRTARGAPRLRVARPVPGGGQVGCRTLRLVSAWRRFTTQVMYTTFSRIGEGNTTFLDPVAEDPIDSRLPVCSGCRHTFRCQTTIGMVAGGDCEHQPSVGGVFLSRSLFRRLFPYRVQETVGIPRR
jgi:hypothetical protein